MNREWVNTRSGYITVKWDAAQQSNTHVTLHDGLNARRIVVSLVPKFYIYTTTNLCTSIISLTQACVMILSFIKSTSINTVWTLSVTA